ncbi:MAG: phospholipase D-like domain-containing protein [Candidatus Hodarchaeales archaeon]|jgi:phosphatidylserine/phosphatidylglycerophosphate/cardiolipin synthase-like enzyme
MHKYPKIRLIFTFLFVILSGFSLIGITSDNYAGKVQNDFIYPKLYSPNEISSYNSTFSSLNTKEGMTLTPFFAPDNALSVYVYWINQANVSIIVQNQYLRQFDNNWDSTPIVKSLVDAHNRGVNVRVQINEAADSDDVTDYLHSQGISVRWMGNQDSSSDDSWLSENHNKLVLIDDKITLLSSVNFSENAFKKNREAGMIIQSSTGSNYYKSISETDWSDGEVPQFAALFNKLRFKNQKLSVLNTDYPSHTNIPLTNFTDTFNVTLFTNPDNAEEVIFNYLNSSKESVYVSMYTISNQEIVDALIDLKRTNPSIDIQILISNRRINPSENIYTKEAINDFLAYLIPVYNSTTDEDKVNGYYHNKYWIIDGKHTFVYSGNWSPRSVSSQKTTYSSGEVNRDMGIAVHDSTPIASFFKNVWDQDIAVASAWDLGVGVKQTSFDTAEVVFDNVTLSAVTSGVEGATFSYRFNENSFTEVIGSDNGFSIDFDTNELSNGINTFEVKAENNSQSFTDKVKINIANYNRELINWRVLITEVYPNPDVVSDTEGEFFELTNSFPFDVLLEGWEIGDNNDLYTFTTDSKIDAFSSIVIGRNSLGFQDRFGFVPDITLDFALANTNDFVQFLDSEGNFIDVVAYGESALDSSEQLEAPDAGQSLQRSPLHMDTNTVKDFINDEPNPKGTVPEIALADNGSSSPLPFLPVVFAIVLVVTFRRSKK